MVLILATLTNKKINKEMKQQVAKLMSQAPLKKALQIKKMEREKVQKKNSKRI